MKAMLIGVILAAAAASTALAVPTQITVRVKAKDAQFVGTSMGGVLVTIKDVRTGKVLARGNTAGGTGSSEKIMIAPRARSVPMSDGNSAKFAASIDIEEPTLIEVTAYGPLGHVNSANKVTATQWVVPGKGISEGDAWLLELPGYVVDVQEPAVHTVMKGTPREVTITAHITMMCGCPLTPNGMWDSSKIEISAIVTKDGRHMGVVPLRYAGSPSQFTGSWNVREAGTYQAAVYAYDAANGNTGVGISTFTVKQ